MTSHKTHQCGRALCVALALAAFTNFGPAAVNGGIPSIVTESARKCQNPDHVTYLNAIERNAVAYCDSNAVAGRQEYMEELQKIMKRRKLHLTVGGTDVGKTKIMQSLIARVKEKDQDTILYVDMRSPGTMDVMKRLEEELLNRGPAVLQKIGRAVDAANLDGVLSPLKGPWRAILAVARFGIAAAPDVKLEKFFESMRNQGKVPVIIIDEANIALPNSRSKEALDFMNFAVRVTKQLGKASVILISSEYGYPYRLQAAGLNVGKVMRVLVAPEVEKKSMIAVLRDKWNMTQELAEAFEENFGGNLFLCQKALDMLISLFEKGDEKFFSPVGVEPNVMLPQLMDDPSTRGHMRSIADRGWSAVNSSNRDGARTIAKENYGAVIDRKATIFEMCEKVKAEIQAAFESGIKQVLIPPSRHMRRCIQHEVELRTRKAGSVC